MSYREFTRPTRPSPPSPPLPPRDSYHATHPSPYADDCPECAGIAWMRDAGPIPSVKVTDPDSLDRHRSRDLALLCFAGIAILVLLAWVTR